VDDPELAACLLHLIREACPVLPIILVAGNDCRLQSEAKRLAVDIVLEAPVTIGDLRRAAQELAPRIPELTSARW
jgi:hypothetical protein